jgi:hypothetical protein
MPVRRLRVQIETERLRVSGTLQLPTEGYRSRTTDFLNGHETGFIALTDAEVAQVDGSGTERRDFVAVGCRHIAVLSEIEDLGISEEDAPRTQALASTSEPPPAAS